MQTILIILIILTFCTTVSLIWAWIDVKKETKRTNAFWQEKSEMFVGADGRLFILFDKRLIIYPTEENIL